MSGVAAQHGGLARPATPATDPGVCRVALWSPLPPPIGGISVWTLAYAKAAPRAGIELHFVDTGPGVGGAQARSRLRLDRVARAAGQLLSLRRTLRTRRPQVAHLCTTLFWAAPREALALALCRRAGVPALLHVRRSTALIAWRRGLSAPARAALAATLRSADAVAVLSRELAEDFAEASPHARIERLPQPVDVERFHPPETRAPGAQLRVLFAGLIGEGKGLADLAAAVAQVPDVQLVVAGPTRGAPAPPLANALRRLADAGRLEMRGLVAPEEMPALYRSADAFALPSRDEGMPIAVLEAMASGLPVIATPVGGVPEVVNGVGTLVPVGDVAALAAAIAALRDQASLRAQLGEAARARAVAQHAMPVVLAAYRALYASLG